MRWLAPVVALPFLVTLSLGQATPERRAPHGYLMAPLGEVSAGARPIAYEPRVGDILLFDDSNRFYHFLYRLACTSPPTHAAMVIAHEDGTPVLLDLWGPSVISARVIVLELPSRLESYPGTIVVRRIKEPLTEAQSAELTRFARAQEGKEFAVKRIVLQATPFRARVGLRRHCFARTHFDRSRWFCSELVVAAACTAKILDPRDYPANAIYPHDLAYDEWMDLSHRYEPPLPWIPAAQDLPQFAPDNAIATPKANR